MQIPMAFLAEQAGGKASNGKDPYFRYQTNSCTNAPYFVGTRDGRKAEAFKYPDEE